MTARLGSDPETGVCLDCEAGRHGIIREAACLCCGAAVVDA